MFKIAAQIITASPDLKRILKVVASTKTISCYGNGSSYKAISREAGTKHGTNPGLVIYDELAQAKDMELFDFFRDIGKHLTGMEQPRLEWMLLD